MIELSRAPEVHVRTRNQLEEAGFRRSAIEKLIAQGSLIRLGGGFYGTDRTPAHVERALRRNHRITCVGALEFYGFWVPPASGAHEARRRRGHQRAAPEPAAHSVVLHHPVLRAWPDDHPVLPLPIALEQALHCLDDDGAAIVLESGLNRELLTEPDVHVATASLSRLRRRGIFPVRRDAESGTETVVRRALERRRIAVRAQVEIPGVGRVDLLLGEKLIIECDSMTYHAAPEQYWRDRERDLVAKQIGYSVVRLTYEQVMEQWSSTLEALLVMIRRHDHRVPRSLRGTLIEDGLLRSQPCARR